MPPSPCKSLCGSDADVCSSALLIPAILGCRRKEPPLIPLSEFPEPALNSTSPLSINHDGLFPAVTVSFNLAPGVSLQQATVAIEKLQQRLAMSSTVREGFSGTAGNFQNSLIAQLLLLFMAFFAPYLLSCSLYN